jgi:hypothetical protein
MKTHISMRTILFFLILPLLFLNSCEKIDTNWHKYQDRKSELWGKSENIRKISIPSDGWRIIEPVNKNKDDYEWGWEVTLRIEPPDEPPAHGHFLLEIAEIKYSLLDEDGFVLVTDTFNIRQEGNIQWNDKTVGLAQNMGEEKIYRQTARISKQKALRARNSKFLISIK